MAISRTGFEAQKVRERVSILKEKKHLSELESTNPFLFIDNYENYNLESLEKIFREKLVIKVELNEYKDSVLRISPFLIDQIIINPFIEESRNYPIDFGTTKDFTYHLKLKIPDEYKVRFLPKNTGKVIPNNGGLFLLKYEQKKDYISVLFKLNLTKGYYLKKDYQYLKKLYSKIIEVQKINIELEKKE